MPDERNGYMGGGVGADCLFGAWVKREDGIDCGGEGEDI